MIPPNTILLATDFTGRCDRPRERAVHLARDWSAKLILLHVLRDDGPTRGDRKRDIEWAEAKLCAEVRDDSIAVCTRVAFGDVATTVIETSVEFGVDLIVTGISRRDEFGDFVVGTTVERVARRGSSPLLVVKERPYHPYRRLMVATDFSERSGAALRTAVAFFPAAEVSLLHAYHVHLEAVLGREGPAAARQREIAWELDAFLDSVTLPAKVRERLDVNVDYGDICSVARDHVQARDSDLAVVGTRGRSGLVTAVLGSTARALLQCLQCDVLLVTQGTGPTDLRDENRRRYS